MQRLNKLKNAGGALISALFITAVAATIATALAVRQRLLIHEAQLIMNANQAYLNLQSVQDWGRYEVAQYAAQFANPKPPVNPKPLKATFPGVTIDDMQLSGQLDDGQGKYNINNLAYSANQPNFVALLGAVMPSLSSRNARALAQAVTAWMTTGSQDRYYMSLHPPYRSSRIQMANISELRLIKGMTPKIFNALEPYITALPIQVQLKDSSPPPKKKKGTQTPAPQIQTPINVNSASWPVFLAENPKLNQGQAQSLESCRKRYGTFSSTQMFQTDCVKQMNLPTVSNVTTNSKYFMLHSEAVKNDRAIQLNSLLVTRVEKDNKLFVMVQWQSFH